MIEEDRYCMDVLNQLLASEAILRRAEREVLRAPHGRGAWPKRFERADETDRGTEDQ